jgi:large subunit ribosomal protein L31
MKKNIHPEYHSQAKVSCACGNVFYVGSTKKEMAVEICYACHPFFTGNEKLIDTAGRVEKFKAKRAAAKTTVKSKATKKAEKKVKKVVKAKK